MIVYVTAIARLSARCTKVHISYRTRIICYPSHECFTGRWCVPCKSEVSDPRRSHAGGSVHTTWQADSSLASLPPRPRNMKLPWMLPTVCVVPAHCKAEEEFIGRSSENDCRRHS